MKRIGQFDFPDGRGDDEGLRRWKPAMRMFPLHDTALCVAQTRIEGTWKAYCKGVEGFNHDLEAMDVLGHGNQMPEDTARTLFPEFKGVPYAR